MFGLELVQSLPSNTVTAAGPKMQLISWKRGLWYPNDSSQKIKLDLKHLI